MEAGVTWNRNESETNSKRNLKRVRQGACNELLTNLHYSNLHRQCFLSREVPNCFRMEAGVKWNRNKFETKFEMN